LFNLTIRENIGYGFDDVSDEQIVEAAKAAFAHDFIEGFVSVNGHQVSDMYALEAVELISRHLPVAYADGRNLEARSRMLLASLLAGKALAMAGVGLVHAMAYPLGGMFGIPHGLANAVLLPYVMAYNVIGAPEKYATLAQVMGREVEGMSVRDAAEEAVDAVSQLNYDVGIPSTLAALKIPRKQITKMAEIALTVTRPVENNPRQPTLEEVVEIYEVAMEGWG